MHRWCLAFLLVFLPAAVHADVSPVVRSALSIPQGLAAETPYHHPEFEALREQQAPAVPRTVIPQHSVQQDSAVPFVQAEALNLTFPANIYDNFTPPDPILAVGPSHVITVVNTSLGIYRKSDHQRVFFATFRNWFSSLTVGAHFFFDPKVLYDQINGRYLLMCLAGNATHSWVFFSVSKTSNPLGDWAFYALDMQLNNTNHAAIFADFPGLGIDRQAIYITANMYGADNTFRYAKLRILKKSQVYAFGAVHWRDFINLLEVTGQKAINIQPVHTFGTTDVEYLVETNAVRGNKITLWTVLRPVTTPALAKRGITVSSYQTPPGARQKGGASLINSGDSGVLNAVYRNGFLYTAHSIAHNWGSGSVSAIRFYQFRPDGAVVQEITFGRDGLSYFYPAVMPDSHGNIIIAYNRSGTSEYTGFWFTGRRATDAPGSLQGGIRVKAGLTTDTDANPDTGRCLWGDYNGIAVDGGDSFWILGEFTKSSSQWGTYAGRIHY